MILNALNKISYIIAALLILASLYYQSFNITLSVALGAAIVVISFKLLCWLIINSFKEAGRSKMGLFALALFKLAILGIILWLIVVKLPIHSIAFLAGLSTMVMAVLVYGLMSLIKGHSI